MYAYDLYALDSDLGSQSVLHGTKLYSAVWMGQFCPTSHHVVGQNKFEHAPPHYAQADLQTAGA